jgi:hypothetical protein
MGPEQILLVSNPQHRKSSRRRKNPARRSAKQKAATARLLAWNRSHRSGHHKKARRRNPSAPAFFKNAVKRTTRRHGRRRNPSFAGAMGAGGLMGMLEPAAIGAAGAVGVDIIMGYVNPSLPASLQTTTLYPLVKGAIAVAIGMWGKGLLGRNAEVVAGGSLVTILHTLLQSFVPSTITMGNRMGNLRYISPAVQFIPRWNQQLPPGTNPRLAGMRGMGAYVPGLNIQTGAPHGILTALRPANMAGMGRYVTGSSVITRPR